MPTTGDAERDLIMVALIVVGVIGYVAIECVEYVIQEHAAMTERNRRVRIRTAIEEGRCGGHPEGELFNELYLMVASDQAEIAAVTDKVLRKLRGSDCPAAVETPALDARNLFDDIALRLDSSSFEDAIATLAFILQRTARQLKALRRGEDFLPVFEYLFELRQAELDVASGRRIFRFESLPHAVGLLCDLRKGMQGDLAFVLRKHRTLPRRRRSPST